MLGVLTLILAFNNVDRLVLGLVQEDIKSGLALSDTQLGLLSGIAFALFYSVMGIPIARWADRGNRVTIISVTTALWSLAVAWCGAAASFSQLLLIRVGVAVGEAGCVPPAHSLIADHFSRAERPRAMAHYMQGMQIALVIGYFGAGWLNEWYGWRATFAVVGLPGLVLALLAWRTLNEPRLKAPVSTAALDFTQDLAARPPIRKPPSVREVVVTLASNAAFRNLLICFSLWYLFGYGLLQWQPTFFIRSHGLQSGEVGTWFAMIYGVIGGIGVYLGGALAARYAAGNERVQLNSCAVAFIFFALVEAISFLVPNYHLAFLFLTLASLGGNMCQGPIVATIQTLVAPHMRAMSIAVVYLFANLIGLGLGPLAAGALSDALRPWFGAESLRYALVILCPGYFWAAFHLWRASRTVARDVRAAQESEEIARKGLVSESETSLLAKTSGAS